MSMLLSKSKSRTDADRNFLLGIQTLLSAGKGLVTSRERSVAKSAVLRGLESALEETPSRMGGLEIGIPAWQIRLFLSALERDTTSRDFASIRTRFEKRIWPKALEESLEWPSTDYFLGSFGPVAALDPSRDRARSISKKIFDQIEKSYIQVGEVGGWPHCIPTHQDQGQMRCVQLYQIDLSFPHGFFGTLVTLARLSGELGGTARFGSLARSAIRSAGKIARLGPVERVRFYPEVVASSLHSRVSWCRSDLSAGLAASFAARRLKSPSLEKLSRLFFTRVKSRTPAELLTDNPYLCHGSSGNAYLLRLASEETGDPSFELRSRRLVLATLGRLKSGKFPRQGESRPNPLTELDACALPLRTLLWGFDRSWELLFGFGKEA